jgi:isopentenyldiphosphate isomerase
MSIIDRNELVSLLQNAKKQVRVFGAVAFDIPFDLVRDSWLKKVNAGQLTIEVVCESDASLSRLSSISSDKSISHQERGYDIGTFLNIKNEPQKKLRDYFIQHKSKHLEPEIDAYKSYLKILDDAGRKKAEVEKEAGTLDFTQFKQCLSIRTYYLSDIQIPVINIDDDYYVGLSLTKYNRLKCFEKIDNTHPMRVEYGKYFKFCFEDKLGAKRYSTEITAADNQTEVILAYNDKRQVVGQLPRNSFINSTRPKLVIWGMVFTRDGKLLIHQRSQNAKDNRGMWDKSVGGHVDINDTDTVKAAARELIEELYKSEVEDQGQHGNIEKFNVNADKPNFLGEWRPEMRYTLPFREIANKEDEFYFFRMDYALSRRVINSPRKLNDGNIQPVKVFVDLYVFVMPKEFESRLDLLKNSKYKLIDLFQLKDNYLLARNGSLVDMNGAPENFVVTPDLETIINSGELWEEQLTSFVDYLQSSMKDFKQD